MKIRTLAIAAAISIFASAAQAKEVTIAMAGPLSGPVANFGEQMKNGVDQAVKDINQSGGVLGQQIKVKYFDDACDPKQAVTVANQIAAEKVPVVIGHFCSGSSIPASRIYAEEGTLMISPGSTDEKLTEQGFKNVFRVIGRNDLQGSVIAKYVMDTFPGKKIAIVHDKQTASKSLAEGAAKVLYAGKANIVMRENINPGEKDYTSLVTRLKQNNVDVIVYGGYQNEAGLIVRQIRDQGLKTVLFGSDALASNDFWAITGDAGQGTLYTFPPDLTKLPQNKELLQRFQSAKISYDGYTLYSYAALKLWADTVNKIGAAEPSKVIPALRETEYDTALGKVAFDKKGDLKNATYAVYEFQKGKMVQISK